MSREREDMRTILERLDAAYPGQECLTRADVARFMGVTRQTVHNRYGDLLPARKKITKVQVARVLSA